MLRVDQLKVSKVSEKCLSQFFRVQIQIHSRLDDKLLHFYAEYKFKQMAK